MSVKSMIAALLSIPAVSTPAAPLAGGLGVLAAVGALRRRRRQA